MNLFNRNNKKVFIYIYVCITFICIFGAICVWHYHKTENLRGNITSNKLASTTNKHRNKNTDTDSATKLVQSLYNRIIVYEEKDPGVSQGEVNSVRSDLTSSLADNVSNHLADEYDPIICAQALPNRITVSPGASFDDSETVSVKESFGTYPYVFPVKVNLSTLKISSITCPE